MNKAILTKLSGGTRVLCEQMSERESVALGVWVETGSRHEPKRLQGISHFLEHMLFKGTPRRSSRQISQAIEGIGGSLNGFTSEECTCYWARVRRDHLRDAVDVLLDLVNNPKLDENDLARERGVILEEMRMYRDNPAYHVHELIQEAMWPNQPLGRSILGVPSTIGKMNKTDLSSYHLKHYAPKNISLVACGGLDNEKLLDLVRQRIPLSIKHKASRRSGKTAIFSQAKDRVIIDRRETEQANLSLGFPGLARSHPLRYDLILLSIILGGNMSSRLFQQIREKRGWVYSIRSDPESYRDCGDLVINAGLPPHKITETVKVIGSELKKLMRKPPAKAELNRAREYYLGQSALSLEKTSSRMFWLGGNLLATGKAATPEVLFNKVKQVTPEGVQKTARLLFESGNCCAAVIGPIEQDTNPQKLLPL